MGTIVITSRHIEVDRAFWLAMRDTGLDVPECLVDMKTHDSLLDALIGDIYEASYRPAHWPVVLEKLVKLTSSKSAVFIFRFGTKSGEKLEGMMSLNMSYGIEKKWIEAYNNYYASIDPQMNFIPRDLPLGTATAEHQNVPDRSYIEQHEFYTGFMAPQGMHHAAGSILFHDDARVSLIGVQRGHDIGTYDDETIAKLSMLGSHFQRALRIHTEFTRLRTREQALYGGFDKLAMGMVLFDAMEQIVYINPMAESILEHHPAIAIEQGRIRTCDLKQGLHLQRAIRNAVSSGPEHIDTKSFAIGLTHPDGAAPLPVLVTPLDKTGIAEHVDASRVYAAMFFSDPARQQSIAPDVLQQVYGLTQRESEIAVSLCNGLNADEISEAYGITYHTARTHVRAVFQKTGVNRQTELVKLLLTGPYSLYQ